MEYIIADSYFIGYVLASVIDSILSGDRTSSSRASLTTICTVGGSSTVTVCMAVCGQEDSLRCREGPIENSTWRGAHCAGLEDSGDSSMILPEKIHSPRKRRISKNLFC
jgi:hypothetical protein